MSETIGLLEQWGYAEPRVIGKGAFSEVYCVKDAATGRSFACKVSGEQNMLKRESFFLQKLSHPLFPAFHAYRQWGELAFLVMEYVEGINLKELIALDGPLPEARVIEIAVELAEGLSYLHELTPPILFRDLKPDNIMLGTDGKVKLLDLGSACISGAEKQAITGTPGFAAPEQWVEEAVEGFYSDVYGLARVICYMLIAPREAYAEWELQGSRIMKAKVHRGVALLLEECLRKDYRERIPDMRYFLQKLAPYYSGSRGEILKSEIVSYFHRKNAAEYIFQKNILNG